VTIDLDRLIKARLAEIAEAAWAEHRVMRVPHASGRVLELGTAAVQEAWVCLADHGSGVCNEPLLTDRQANMLLGMVSPDEPVPDPQLPVVEVELLDESIGAFMPDVLIHWSDVIHEYRKQG
jgi:hypothetical protein